jgi:two-component system nitrogen regulation response regulator NtrX
MEQEFKILIIEDQESFRTTVMQLLGVYNEIQGAGTLAEARILLQKQSFDVVILDKTLPDGDGISLISEIKSDSPNTVTIVLTADGDFNTMKKCIRSGADDYVVKTSDIIPHLLVRIPIAASRKADERQISSLQLQIQKAFKYECVGRSKLMAELRLSIQGHRGSSSPVLITGESGSGKEVVARRLHAVEQVRNRPFVAINCGAIPETLIESELFGHKKGAFTGAISDQSGKFDAAHGGDIFLDEVGELSLQAQTKLLRVLQEKQFYRVGSSKPVEVSCRVIAATNQNLEDLVKKKKFREDLYYRLNVVRFRTPSLRSRIEDIPDLVQHFLVQNGLPNISVTDRAYEKLSKHDWPGNIRELGNVIERGTLSARKRNSIKIDHDDISIDRPLDAIDAGARRIEMALPMDDSDLSEKGFLEYMELAEREYLKRAISIQKGSVTDTAKAIGVSRSSLFRRISALGLSKKSQAGDDEYFEERSQPQGKTSASLNPYSQNQMGAN